MFATGRVVKFVAEVAVLAVEKKVYEHAKRGKNIDGWSEREELLSDAEGREIPRFARNDEARRGYVARFRRGHDGQTKAPASIRMEIRRGAATEPKSLI